MQDAGWGAGDILDLYALKRKIEKPIVILLFPQKRRSYFKPSFVYMV